ncbi:MAG: hypothetical protein B7Y01_01605 [Xanthobacter sp. 17-67-6]|nr:MAG: hypothetical protein B7Y01_01605 [Xanthobacter sp. 17-67-6]
MRAALAGPVDPALLTGPMEKLILETPRALPEVALQDMADQAASLAPTRGKWLVLNLWATWCMPCREEMPALDKLAAAGRDITAALGRVPASKVAQALAAQL